MNPQIITVASGKGGVGKSFVSANLARIFSRNNDHRVLLIDGDFGLSNLDVLLGVRCELTIDDFLYRDVSISDVIVNVGKGFDLLPASNGVREGRELGIEERRRLLYSLEDISNRYDMILIDCPPGVSRDTLQLCAMAHKTVVVVTPEPTSLTDAYAFIKLMKENYREEKFSVLINMVRNAEEGVSIFKRLLSVTSDFLGVSLDYVGFLPHDLRVQESIRSRQLLVDRMNHGSWIKSMKEVSTKLLEDPGVARIWQGGLKALWPIFLQAGPGVSSGGQA